MDYDGFIPVGCMVSFDMFGRRLVGQIIMSSSQRGACVEFNDETGKLWRYWFNFKALEVEKWPETKQKKQKDRRQ